MFNRSGVFVSLIIVCILGLPSAAAEDEFDMDMDFPEPDISEAFPEQYPEQPEAEVLPEIDAPEVELPIAPPPEEVIPPEEILPPIIVLPPPIYWLDDPWDNWYLHDYPRHYYRPASISVRVNGGVRIRIVDSEQRTLVNDTLSEGAFMQWQGQAPFAVTVSDPALIAISYQGKTIDLSAYKEAESAYFQVPPNP